VCWQLYWTTSVRLHDCFELELTAETILRGVVDVQDHASHLGLLEEPLRVFTSGQCRGLPCLM
jgi:hypothetical protein